MNLSIGTIKDVLRSNTNKTRDSISIAGDVPPFTAEYTEFSFVSVFSEGS